MRRAEDDELDVLLDFEARRYRQSATRRCAKKWLESWRRWPSPDLVLGAEVYLMQCRLRAALRHIIGKGQPPRTVGLQLVSGDRALRSSRLRLSCGRVPGLSPVPRSKRRQHSTRRRRDWSWMIPMTTRSLCVPCFVSSARGWCS